MSIDPSTPPRTCVGVPEIPTPSSSPRLLTVSAARTLLESAGQSAARMSRSAANRFTVELTWSGATELYRRESGLRPVQRDRAPLRSSGRGPSRCFEIQKQREGTPVPRAEGAAISLTGPEARLTAIQLGERPNHVNSTMKRFAALFDILGADCPATTRRELADLTVRSIRRAHCRSKIAGDADTGAGRRARVERYRRGARLLPVFRALRRAPPGYPSRSAAIQATRMNTDAEPQPERRLRAAFLPRVRTAAHEPHVHVVAESGGRVDTPTRPFSLWVRGGWSPS